MASPSLVLTWVLGVLIYLAKLQDEDQRCRRRNVWYREVPAWAPSPSSYNQRRQIPTSVIVTTLRDAISTFKLGFLSPERLFRFSLFAATTNSFVLSQWFGRERPKCLIFETLLGLVVVSSATCATLYYGARLLDHPNDDTCFWNSGFDCSTYQCESVWGKESVWFWFDVQFLSFCHVIRINSIVVRN